jgi:hypothetical protein
MSRKNPESKAEPGIKEVAENAELRIRVLQSRLAERESGGRKMDAVDDLERELQKYFSAESGRAPLDQIRKRVIDGVVDRIIRDWEPSSEQEGDTAPLESEIVSRLVERIFERLIAARAESDHSN